MNMKRDNYFLQCCVECGGKCCKAGGLYITSREYKKVPNKYRDGFKKHYSGYVTYLGKQCPFIIEKGCILNENRFLECKLYPLEINGINKLILKKECLYNKLFDNDTFFSKGYELLSEYVKKGLFNKDDVISILNNKYPDKL